LERSDFRLFEDGVEADIALFTADVQPLSVAVMVDTSASITGLPTSSRPAMAGLRRAILAFMHSLRPDDLASLGSFGFEVAVGRELTNDRGGFERILDEELWGGGGTPLWQATELALDSIAKVPGKRVVLLYTDGFDTGGLEGLRGTRDTLEAKLVESGVMAYAVRPPTKDSTALRPIPKELAALTHLTGGSSWEIPSESVQDFETTFARVAEELRNQYLLGFVPRARDGKAHRIEVRSSREGHIVRFRQRFIAAEK
jgi:VWFA-related protein